MRKKFKRFKKWFAKNKKNIGLGFLSIALASGLVALHRHIAKRQFIYGYAIGCSDTGRLVVESLGGTVDDAKLNEFCANAAVNFR